MKRMLAPSSLLVALALLASAGCAKPGPAPLMEYTLDDLPMAMRDPVADTWESSPWSGTGVAWIPYGPHAQIRLEHDLGRVPDGVATYLSFTEDGQTPSQAAGDLARVVEVTDTHVTVWNDTNGAYYARVVLF
ncbi:MAG: hypothetical protein U0234_02510 [Sandaracinus sp.]